MSQFAPSAQADSYSTLSMRRPLYGPSLISTSFLQATGQAWQVGLPTRMWSLTNSPLIFSARSPNEVTWLFLAGRAPIALVTFIRTLVPYTERPPLRGAVTFFSSMMVARALRRTAGQAAASAAFGVTRADLTTIAFRFLAPPTAPVPP